MTPHKRLLALKKLIPFYVTFRAPVRFIFICNILCIGSLQLYIFARNSNFKASGALAALVSPLILFSNIIGFLWLLKGLIDWIRRAKTAPLPLGQQGLIFDSLLLLPGLYTTSIGWLISAFILSLLLGGERFK